MIAAVSKDILKSYDQTSKADVSCGLAEGK